MKAGKADAGAGAKDRATGGLTSLLDELLEGDFDPEAYDKRMAAAFDDDYYQVSHALSLLLQHHTTPLLPVTVGQLICVWSGSSPQRDSLKS